MVLPLVLIGLLLMCVMSMALQQTAWRAARGARTTWELQRGLYTADAAVVRYSTAWSRDSMAATPIGTPLQWNEISTDGWQTRTTMVRTGTLVAIVQAVTDRALLGTPNPARPGDPRRIHRVVFRALHLDPPSMPLRAAVTVLGDVDYGGVDINGRDSIAAYSAGLDDCGPLRDTASLPALAASALQAHDAPVLVGGGVTIGAPNLSRDRSAFDSAFRTVVVRGGTVQLTAPAALGGALGGALAGARPWRASVIQAPGSVTVDSASAYRGLLAIDGDLVVRGTLDIDGLLLVRGSLDASQGSLTVRGALIVRDVAGTGTRLGAGVRVRLAPCLAGRALVAVSEPRSSPFGVWNSP